MLTSSKATLVLILGAAATGWIGALLVRGVVRATRVKDDAALGVVLASFFGVGLVLLTFVQRWPEATQAGLNRFLFGQAATLLERDVWMIARHRRGDSPGGRAVLEGVCAPDVRC